ncbi:MAG: hypothetical protein EAX86_06955 [Candidatus Heimdallarchaeota archaeon]|nr:hypothetical protein [Candidatus Heimdallarchaeota archaeon]
MFDAIKMENQNKDISYEERLFCEWILRHSGAARFSRIATDTLGKILKRDFNFKEFPSVIIKKESETGISFGRPEDPEADIVRVATNIAKKAVTYAQQKGRRTIKASDIEAVVLEVKKS